MYYIVYLITTLQRDESLKDYVKELMETWTTQGEQEAYSRVRELLLEVRSDVVRLRKQEEAIQALGMVLREHPDVDVSEEPGEVPPGLDLIEPSERSRLIIEAAQEFFGHLKEQRDWYDNSPFLIRTQDVFTLLKSRGLDLGVQQPLAVIGTVLTNADGFHRIARNTFQVREEETISPIFDETDDLPF